MTKVTLHYDLGRKLTEDDYPNVAAVHSVYGMVRYRVRGDDPVRSVR